MFKFKKFKKTIEKEIKNRYDQMEERFSKKEKGLYTVLENRLGSLESKFDELSDLLKVEIEGRSTGEKAPKTKKSAKSSDKKTKESSKKSKKTTKKKAEKKVTKLVVLVKDDLTEIKGLGEKFEEKLNEQGIATYAQLAALSENQIQALEGKIKSFAARYSRYEWGVQAKKLK
jgi:predicted flap endonuclease-1-like 5' DNA nuclease